MFIVSILLYSCQTKEEETTKPEIASVYDKKLYKEEILKSLPAGLNENDSLNFVNNYIDLWVKENILLHTAEKKLSHSSDLIETRIEKYRRSLVIYEYEKQFIQENLDTAVSYTEIENYYNENKEDFTLNDYIIKCVYVKLEKDAKGKDKVLKWIRSDKKEDLIKLEEFCVANAVSYYQDRDNWIFFNDILKDIPLNIPNIEYFLRSNKLISFEDDEYSYNLYLIDHKMKEELSPISLEKENIRSRILQSRMNELIKDMRNKTIKKAYDEDEIKINSK